MKRDFLFAYYQTPSGKLLKSLEVAYLQRSITVGCQQTILQVGGLGWENEFIDCSLYQSFSVLDAKQLGWDGAGKIQAKSYALPIQSNSVDMIIVPHLLEFDSSRFQTFRELERILKPEGILLVLNFNPWSFWVRYQYLLDKRLAYSWRGNFISRSRLFDWLKLLMADDIPDEILKNRDHSKAIPPLYGALLKNEQDVHLLERLAFMHRRESR